MNNVAGTLFELGRHAAAVALFEKTLAFRQRVLPENHPDIGACSLLAVPQRRFKLIARGRRCCQAQSCRCQELHGGGWQRWDARRAAAAAHEP